MAGFDNDVIYGSGLDLSGSSAVSNQLDANGKIYFGNGSGNPVAGLPTSNDGTITFDDTNPILDMSANKSNVFKWVVETGATRNLAAFDRVFGNRATAQTFTLPAICAVGDEFEIVQMGAGNITIDYNVGQSITSGPNATTVTTGALTSTDLGDHIKLVCNVANTSWIAIDRDGTWIPT